MLRTTSFEFRTPSSVLIVGPSASGKTVFTTRLLTDNLDLFATRPNRIHYCYGSWQKSFEKLKKTGVTFSAGVPTEEELDKRFPRGGLLVMDDLMTEGNNDKTVLDIFTKHSSTCVRTCFLRANLPRASPETPITSWPSRIPGISWACGTRHCRRFPSIGRRCWTCFVARRLDPLATW